MTDKLPELQAINYIKQYIKTIENDRNRLDDEIMALNVKKDQLVLDREDLTGRESAFLKKIDGHGREVERITKMSIVAKKMKAQIDTDSLELKIDTKALDKRESKIEDLEKKQKVLKAREELTEAMETDLAERETLVEKQKKLAREKQRDLENTEKSIKKKQDQLQKMIEAQRMI